MLALKTVLVGDGAVGKTCLAISHTTKSFPGGYVPTIFDNYSFTIEVEDEAYTIGLFDTAGQSDYDRLRPLSYPNTDVFLVCFSVVDYVSLENVADKWVPEINHYCPDVPYILVGTKLDLRTDPSTIEDLSTRNLKPVTEEMGKEWAQMFKAAKYVECSALTYEGLDDVFTEGVKAALAPPPRKKKGCKLL